MPKVMTRDVTPEVSVSPALSLFARPGDGSIRTRRVAILVADGCDGAAARGARRSADQRRRRAALRLDDARFGAAGRRRCHRGGRQPRGGAGRALRRVGAAGRRPRPSTRFAPTGGPSSSSRTSTATASRSSRWARATQLLERLRDRRGTARRSAGSGPHRRIGRRRGARTTSSPPSPSIGTSPEKPIRRACEETRRGNSPN